MSKVSGSVMSQLHEGVGVGRNLLECWLVACKWK